MGIDRAPHFAWCSPTLSWPRIMFSQRVCYDRRRNCRKIECFESSGWQIECFESSIWQTRPKLAYGWQGLAGLYNIYVIEVVQQNSCSLVSLSLFAGFPYHPHKNHYHTYIIQPKHHQHPTWKWCYKILLVCRPARLPHHPHNNHYHITF